MELVKTIIPKRELLAYQADVKGSIFRQIRQIFSILKDQGFTQKDLAARINMDPGQLSRRIRGDYDLQLETLSDLARGLECRIDVRLTPLSQSLSVDALPRPATIASNFDLRSMQSASDHHNDNRITANELAS